MGIFLVICALVCLGVIAWAFQSHDVSGEGAATITFIFGCATLALLLMAAININGSHV